MNEKALMTGPAPEGGLALERYALVVAHLRHFVRERPERVLARFGITAVQWQSSSAAWIEKLREETEVDQGDLLARRFGAAYGVAILELKSTRPNLVDVGDAPRQLEKTSGEAEHSPIEPARLAPEHLSVWQVSTDAAAMPSPVVEDDLDVTIQGAEPSRRHVLPFDAATAGTSATRPPPVGNPIHKASRSVPSDSAAANANESSSEALDEIDVDATMEAVRKEGATLPFGVKASAEFEAWLASRPDEAPRGPRASAFATIEGEAIGHAVAPLPFAGRRNDPAMPLEQYASFCAALTVFPQRAEEIYGRFGVADDESKVAIDQAWRSAFGRDPGQLARWRELFNRFCAALAIPHRDAP